MSELDEVEELNESIKKLRVLYEQYFAGVERFAPVKDRDLVKKTLRRLMSTRSNNTAFKFRIQSTQATFITYETYWDRIARQIEEGTFKRDRLKAKKLIEEPEATPAQPPQQAPAPAAPPVAAAPRPAAYPESLRKLHEAYSQARLQTGDARPVSIDNLAETVRKQIAAVKAQYKCERVEFKVAFKDGKAILKAIPK